MWPIIAVGAGLAWLFSGCERTSSAKKDQHGDVKSGEKDSYESPKKTEPFEYNPKWHPGAKW